MLDKKKLAIVGLGYVGLPLAVEFGKKFNVVGFDISSQRIDELKGGIDRTQECSTAAILDSPGIKFSSNEADLSDCEVFVVTVPTPIDQANRPDLGPLCSASETIARHLSQGDIVIYESTVFPGATEEVCVPILEAVSGLIYNQDFYCGYSPERINPGDKVNTLSTIRKIVSASMPHVLDEISDLYASIITAGTWRTSSIAVAEASKVIENTQRDLNIAFVNELSLIFERLGIDTLEVLEAAGTKWNFMPFRPGMVGGHCIGVDPYYLTFKAEQIGYQPQIILAGRRVNDEMARYAARNIIKRMVRRGIHISKSTVGVLGVTFKENCPDIRNSKVFDLMQELESWGVTITAVDCWADPDEVVDQYAVALHNEIHESTCDALVVAVGHQEHRSMKPEELMSLCKDSKSAVVGDLKGIYDFESLVEIGFDVFRL